MKIDIPIHLSNIAVMACVSDSIIWTDRKIWWLHIWLLTEIAYKLLRSRHVSQFVLTFLILVSPIHRAKRLSVISLSILHQTLRDSMMKRAVLRIVVPRFPLPQSYRKCYWDARGDGADLSLSLSVYRCPATPYYPQALSLLLYRVR